ncbi:hypothetical protein CQ056_21155 [Peribacillus simplex]|nr:hypothetical protein CQ056_21155 [Peribacillus simplex]
MFLLNLLLQPYLLGRVMRFLSNTEQINLSMTLFIVTKGDKIAKLSVKGSQDGGTNLLKNGMGLWKF